MTNISVPKDFSVRPFYDEAEEIIIRNSFTENLRYSPFFYDILYEYSTGKLYPWQQWQERLPFVFLLWKETNEEIFIHFTRRDRKAVKEPMVAMIALLMNAIFWLNEEPIHSLIHWQKQLKALPFVPVNAIERLQFMLEAPDHFHSYNQLKSLFEEVEKSYFRKLTINKG